MITETAGTRQSGIVSRWYEKFWHVPRQCTC